MFQAPVNPVPMPPHPHNTMLRFIGTCTGKPELNLEEILKVKLVFFMIKHMRVEDGGNNCLVEDILKYLLNQLMNLI